MLHRKRILAHSQTAIGPYPEPVEASLHLYNLLLEGLSIYALAAPILRHSYLIDVLTIQRNRERGRNILRCNDKRDKKMRIVMDWWKKQ